MIKVKYVSGEVEYFPGNDYRYLWEENMFEIVTGNHRLWLPVANVKSIGCGTLVGEEFKYD